MNIKRTLVILAAASSLGLFNARSAAPEDNDEGGDAHHRNPKIEENSTDEHHHGHGPKDMEHGHRMEQGRMHGKMGDMTEERHQMMRERQKMMSKLQSAQADLDKKIEKMNSSTGPEKIEAMSAVINEMAHQRKEMLAHMAKMQKRMMARMDHMRSMMGNPEHEPAGAPPPHHEEEK
jgi:hypothetical protein